MTFKHKFKKKHNRNGATIRANATIVCGYTIGRYAFIGAGAVVTMDVPDYALVLGSPARSCLPARNALACEAGGAVAGGLAKVVGWMCECGHRIDFENDITHCSDCGKQYRRTGKEIKSIDDQMDYATGGGQHMTRTLSF